MQEDGLEDLQGLTVLFCILLPFYTIYYAGLFSYEYIALKMISSVFFFSTVPIMYQDLEANQTHLRSPSLDAAVVLLPVRPQHVLVFTMEKIIKTYPLRRKEVNWDFQNLFLNATLRATVERCVKIESFNGAYNSSLRYSRPPRKGGVFAPWNSYPRNDLCVNMLGKF